MGRALFPVANIESLFAYRSPLQHQLLFVCRESYKLVLEKYSTRWQYTEPNINGWNSEQSGYNLVGLDQESWELTENDCHTTVRLFRIRKHFLAQEYSYKKKKKNVLLDLENDIVRLIPTRDRPVLHARLEIMVRWFPFLPSIRRFSIPFSAILELLFANGKQ